MNYLSFRCFTKNTLETKINREFNKNEQEKQPKCSALIKAKRRCSYKNTSNLSVGVLSLVA